MGRNENGHFLSPKKTLKTHNTLAVTFIRFDLRNGQPIAGVRPATRPSPTGPTPPKEFSPHATPSPNPFPSTWDGSPLSRFDIIARTFYPEKNLSDNIIPFCAIKEISEFPRR
jgi:hypothetical protein